MSITSTIIEPHTLVMYQNNQNVMFYSNKHKDWLHLKNTIFSRYFLTIKAWGVYFSKTSFKHNLKNVFMQQNSEPYI